jgi:hypothetical protein
MDAKFNSKAHIKNKLVFQLFRVPLALKKLDKNDLKNAISLKIVFLKNLSGPQKHRLLC